MTTPTSRCLLVTNVWPDASSGGRQQLCALNREALEGLYGDRLEVIELPRRRLRGLGEAFNSLCGYIDGVDAPVIAQALHIVRSRDIDTVFVDGEHYSLSAAQARLGRILDDVLHQTQGHGRDHPPP